MSLLRLTATIAAILVAWSADNTISLAQTPLIPLNDKILIDYREPANPEFVYNLDRNDPDERVQKLFAKYERLKGVYGRLNERKALERYSQFLVALRLPMTLRLLARQCDTGPYFDSEENSINLCYEWVASLEDEAPTTRTKDGITREDAVIGGIVGALLHETGHAIFHMYQIPVLGREEDGADQIAAYIMLQFTDEVALTTIKGMMWMWRDWNRPYYADSHSTAQQRFDTFLCIAYGGRPTAFQPFIDSGLMRTERAAGCNREYRQIERTFIKTVAPHIDPDLMEKVLSATWFSPQDKSAIPVQTR